MPIIVNIKIRNNTHQIACDDGQEDKVKMLAANLDRRLSDLSKDFPRANEEMLLIMASLIQENELLELKEQGGNDNSSTSEEVVTETIDAVSDYVEALAKRLEKMYNHT